MVRPARDWGLTLRSTLLIYYNEMKTCGNQHAYMCVKQGGHKVNTRRGNEISEAPAW